MSADIGSFGIGSFGARLARDQSVPDSVWVKIYFDEAAWDTTGGFDRETGGYTVGRAGKFHFAAGVRFLAPVRPNRYVDLLLYKNGEPREMLTPDAPFSRPDSVSLASRETPWAEYVRGSTRREVSGDPGDVFEVYVRHGYGEHADLTARHSGPEDEHAATCRHTTYFMGTWHA